MSLYPETHSQLNARGRLVTQIGAASVATALDTNETLTRAGKAEHDTRSEGKNIQVAKKKIPSKPKKTEM